MNDLTMFQTLTLLGVIVNTVVAAAAFHRSGKWRQSDAGRAIAEAVEHLKNEVRMDDGGTVKADIHRMKNDLTIIGVRLSQASRTDDKISEMQGRITTIETTLQHVASRSDIQAVKGEIGGVEQIARNTEAAVTRIETFLMEATRGARG